MAVLIMLVLVMVVMAVLIMLVLVMVVMAVGIESASFTEFKLDQSMGVHQRHRTGIRRNAVD